MKKAAGVPAALDYLREVVCHCHYNHVDQLARLQPPEPSVQGVITTMHMAQQRTLAMY
jgi:hypothetical protein